MIFIQILYQVCCSCSYWNSGLYAIFSICQVVPESWISWYSFKLRAKYFVAAGIETLVYLLFFPCARWHLVSNPWSHDIHSSTIPSMLQLLLLNLWSICHFLLMPGGTWYQTLDLMIFIQVLFQIRYSCLLAIETNFPAIFFLPLAPGFKLWLLWYAIQCSINYATVAALWISTYFWLQRFSATILHCVAHD